MTIIYIEDEIKKNKKKKEILDALESIGLVPLDLPDIEKDVKKRYDKIREYQEWVKERFFQEYELNEHKVISPKFNDGDKNDRD